jgi:uncharacterized protein
MRILLLPFLSAAVLLAIPAHAASYDCAKARTADERAVCASRSLSELDVEMAVRFDTMRGLVAMGTRGDMGDAQRAFLASRRRCGSDARCLTALYRDRIAVLKSQYETLKQGGPY